MTSIRNDRRLLTWKNVRVAFLMGGSVIVLLALLVGLPGYVGYSEIEDLRQQQKTYRGYDPTVDDVSLRGSAPSFPQAEHEKPRANRATCNNPYSREDADLCAQWAAVKAVSTGNTIAIAGLRSTLLGTLVTTIGILLSATGLVIATLASRDAARAVRATENLERGYLNVEVARAAAGTARVKLVNIGRTPVWIASVTDQVRGVIHKREADGIRCVPAGGSYKFIVRRAADGNRGIIDVVIQFSDVLDHLRTVEAHLKITDGVWRLLKLHEKDGK